MTRVHATILSLLTLGLGALMSAQIAIAQSVKSDVRVADLVKSGKLRVGIGLGTPTLAIKNPTTGEMRGPALDLGRALAARIGVEFAGVEYPRPGAVIEGAPTNAWDVAFLVIDAERAKAADFSAPYAQTDFTFLVPANSSIRDVADVDKTGVHIAVPRGDATDLVLSRVLKHAELVRPDTLAAALELLRTGVAQARSAPRPVLLEESDKLPGSRVLDMGVGVIAYGGLVPKGQADHLAYLNEFIEEAKATGLIKHVIDAAGLRGVIVSPP
jgi:polar amino acid transport system substrate-binding protein